MDRDAIMAVVISMSYNGSLSEPDLIIDYGRQAYLLVAG